MKSLAADGERAHALIRELADAGSAAAFALGAEGERFQEAGRLSHTAEDLARDDECTAGYNQRLEAVLERFK
jgi:NAD+--asparagine ADP-ribosyltransferase